MKSSQRSQSESENAGDSCIPFPRTCGAKWCGVSTLVVFNRPTNARRLSLKHETGTPRSMSSLSLTPALFGTGYTSVSPLATTTPSPTNASGFPQLHHRHPSNSITTFYFQDRWVSVYKLLILCLCLPKLIVCEFILIYRRHQDAVREVCAAAVVYQALRLHVWSCTLLQICSH